MRWPTLLDEVDDRSTRSHGGDGRWPSLGPSDLDARMLDGRSDGRGDDVLARRARLAAEQRRL
jgi:hypothetical protein